MAKYRPAPAVERIAEELIPKYHEHLEGVRIEYVFRDKASSKGGKVVAGRAHLKSGLVAYLAQDRPSESFDLNDERFFVIEIAEDVWSALEAAQREALVDHELSHCMLDVDEDDGSWDLSIVGHDVEEFAAVIERHGLWQPDLANLGAVIAERRLLDPEDGE